MDFDHLHRHMVIHDGVTVKMVYIMISVFAACKQYTIYILTAGSSAPVV